MGAAVVAHGDAPPVLEPAEHIFNFVPLFIEFPVVFNLDFAVFPWWNAGGYSFFDQRRSEPVSIIATIRKKFFCSGQCVQDKGCALVIADLACCQMQDDRSAPAI